MAFEFKEAFLKNALGELIWYRENQGSGNNMHPVLLVNEKEDEEVCKEICMHFESGIDRLRSSVLAIPYTIEDRSFTANLNVEVDLAQVLML